MSIQGITLKALAGIGLAALVTVGAGGTAMAKGGTTQVRGMLVPDNNGECTDVPASVGTYVVSGSLVGCWYTDSMNVENESHSGGFRASGTEQFWGCLDTICGKIFTTYTFTAKFVNGVEEHGRCHHPIVRGEGGFAGVSGVIQMHDLPNGCAVYNGHLTL